MAHIALHQRVEREPGAPAFNINNAEQRLAIMEKAKACHAPSNRLYRASLTRVAN